MTKSAGWRMQKRRLARPALASCRESRQQRPTAYELRMGRQVSEVTQKGNMTSGLRVPDVRLWSLCPPSNTVRQRADRTPMADLQYGLWFGPTYEDATLEPSVPIPQGCTRCYGLDPCPVVPHPSLYCAVDLWGDAWAYHELPSRVSGSSIQISCCASGPTGSSQAQRYGSKWPRER